MIQWDSGSLPTQIWGYIDLTFTPTGMSVELSNGKTVEKGVFAIVESVEYVTKQDLGENPITTDIFTLSWRLDNCLQGVMSSLGNFIWWMWRLSRNPFW
jgi:hypothetical protein